MKTAQGASKKRKLFGRKSQFIAFFTTQRLQRNRGFCAFFRICSFIVDNFNPRSPHGERPGGVITKAITVGFQPTLPARGATIQPLFVVVLSTLNFNPRSPHGERRTRWAAYSTAGNFNPRSPHGERRRLSKSRTRSGNFNPRPPHGERRASAHTRYRASYFNPRPPHGERPSPYAVMTCIG